MKWSYSWETSSHRTASERQNYGTVDGNPEQIARDGAKGCHVDMDVFKDYIRFTVGSDYGYYYLKPLNDEALNYCLANA